MEHAVVWVDPKEFGLESTKAATVEAAFKPMLEKMTALEGEYNEIIAQPVTEELAKKAKRLRLDYVKVRTGTAEIHKSLKAGALAFGKFIDGWKNAQIYASEGNEKKLAEIENHFENIERERLAKIQTERCDELAKYGVDGKFSSLADMPDDVWSAYLTGVRVEFDRKKEAEAQAERDRLERERKEREALNLAQEENRRLKETAEKERLERERIERVRNEELRIERERREKVEREQAESRRIEEDRLRKEDEERKRAESAPDNEKIKAYALALAQVPVPVVGTDEAKATMRFARDMFVKLENYLLTRSK